MSVTAVVILDVVLDLAVIAVLAKVMRIPHRFERPAPSAAAERDLPIRRAA
jgi:hypothetical protein